jgi:exopolysaccharide biosynthesis polyprenyl glycosylphosphotransferase
VIVGTDAHAIGLLHTIQRNPDLGYHVVGFVGDADLGERGGVSVLGTYADLEQIIQATDSVGVMVSLSSVSDTLVNTMTRRLTDGGYHVALSSSLRDIDVTRIRPQHLGGRTLIYVEPTIRNGWRAAAKRTFDITISLVALVVTIPIVAVVALANLLKSPGPVFFRQIRVGLDGKHFEMVKLRTMVVDAEARKAELMDQNESDGALFKIRHDPRITPIGRILRKLSLDELPQFWNVLRGEMSVVGPRPALPDEVDKWPSDAHDRLRVLPGITGMWQVSGRSDTSFDEYKRLDLYYVDNWSLVHDLTIVAKTFGAVATSRGAS